MKVLAVHPGATFSVADVYYGLMPELSKHGMEIIHYPMNRAIGIAIRYCELLYKKGFQQNPPTQSDIQYVAGVFSLDRALHYDVDWVFVVSAMWFHPDYLIKLKRAGRKIAILFTESPYEEFSEETRIHYADAVFTNERTTAERWARIHPNVHYLPHAYDPIKHRPEPPEDEPDVPRHDVVFVGTGWAERIALFQSIDWSGIDFGLYGNWGKIPSRARLRRYLIPGPVPNEYTAALYRHAKIGINLHRAHPSAESLNPRAYELAACGVFTLSDDRMEVGEHFGDLMPTFETAADLERLIRQYLADDLGRERITRRLPEAVAGDTFAARAEIVAAAMERVSAGREVVPV